MAGNGKDGLGAAIIAWQSFSQFAAPDLGGSAHFNYDVIFCSTRIHRLKEDEMSIPPCDLHSYVGKAIEDICQNGFSSPAQNHCAHFVSHALGIKLGMLCGNMAFKTRGTGASIRCDELYNRLADRGPWDERPENDNGLLIFVLSARNVRKGVMANVPQKHVGIHCNGKIYNFSNSLHQVVADSSVDAFHKKFQRIYAGDDISLYYGVAA